MPGALLAFHAGPVQEFIRAAQSARDLWTGSYLLSWLVYHAMTPLFKESGHKFIAPAVNSIPLYQHQYQRIPLHMENPELLLSPCLPNRFFVKINDEQVAKALAKNCADAFTL